MTVGISRLAAPRADDHPHAAPQRKLHKAG
jgi:hypothetical protein